ncbi:hypothetical protein ACFLV5_02035 [Chloroflexota bacterium]
MTNLHGRYIIALVDRRHRLYEARGTKWRTTTEHHQAPPSRSELGQGRGCDWCVTRRVAQRAYREWEKARSIRELENVRVKVGEIEFEKHVDALTHLAQHLVDHLMVPEYPSFARDAGTHMALLMDREVLTIPAEAGSRASEAVLKARRVRRNRLLLESLKQHTADTVDWDLLENWTEGWDTCCRSLPQVITLIGETIKAAFSEFQDFDTWFIGKNRERQALDILGEGIQDALWQGIVAGDAAAATAMMSSKSIELAGSEVLEITIGKRLLNQRENRDMAPSIIDLCCGAINDLWVSAEVQEVVAAVEKMQAVVEEMETALEPLVLRPHILHTRCKLCPA